MKTTNGIHVYEPGEQPELPPGLPSTTDVESSFGFKIVKDGQGLKWAAASEQDFRSSEAERLGLRPDQMEIAMAQCACWFTAPKVPITTALADRPTRNKKPGAWPGFNHESGCTSGGAASISKWSE